MPSSCRLLGQTHRCNTVCTHLPAPPDGWPGGMQVRHMFQVPTCKCRSHTAAVIMAPDSAPWGILHAAQTQPAAHPAFNTVLCFQGPPGAMQIGLHGSIPLLAARLKVWSTKAAACGLTLCKVKCGPCSLRFLVVPPWYHSSGPILCPSHDSGTVQRTAVYPHLTDSCSCCLACCYTAVGPWPANRSPAGAGGWTHPSTTAAAAELACGSHILA